MKNALSALLVKVVVAVAHGKTKVARNDAAVVVAVATPGMIEAPVAMAVESAAPMTMEADAVAVDATLMTVVGFKIPSPLFSKSGSRNREPLFCGASRHPASPHRHRTGFDLSQLPHPFDTRDHLRRSGFRL